jgi:hypothetical protein
LDDELPNQEGNGMDDLVIIGCDHCGADMGDDQLQYHDLGVDVGYQWLCKDCLADTRHREDIDFDAEDLPF